MWPTKLCAECLKETKEDNPTDKFTPDSFDLSPNTHSIFSNPYGLGSENKPAFSESCLKDISVE